MITRRAFIKLTSLLTGGILLGCNSDRAYSSNMSGSLIMPEEGEPHERTWMSFVANDYIWSNKQIPEVKKNFL